MANKEIIKEALISGKSISSVYLSAFGLENGGVYINCYSDCNCCMDTFDSFEEFWKYYNDYIWEIDE